MCPATRLIVNGKTTTTAIQKIKGSGKNHDNFIFSLIFIFLFDIVKQPQEDHQDDDLM